jgi:predicted nuclease with TOPRIM domain
MANCQYCGGQLGVDCFNQSDCGWITQQQDAEIAAHEVAQVGQHEREQIEAQLDAANAEIDRLRAELAAAREDSARLLSALEWSQSYWPELEESRHCSDCCCQICDRNRRIEEANAAIEKHRERENTE